jgi:uncharacterized protein
MPYHHGVKVIEVTEGARTLTTVSTSVIGLVATADDADVAAFPLNVPVLLTNIEAGIAKAGLTGTLGPALRAILDHTRTLVIVIRVAHSNVANTLAANVVGTVSAQGQRTGIQALLSCASMFGFKPRILGAPGLDTQAVSTALAAVADKLGAMAYASCIGATNQACIDYRANFGARELMLITPDVKAINPVDGAIVAAASVARALGLRAKIDQLYGFHKTLSNIPMDGVLGLTRDIEFDLMSMDNDAGVLNAAQITTIIRREGYRFWGSRTTIEATSPFSFESATRTAHVLRDTIGEGLFWAVDKPLTPGLAKDIVSTVNQKLSVLTSGGYILGGKCWFDAEKNPASELRNGILNLDYDYTPVPPLESLGFNQRIVDSYFVNFNQLRAAV